MLLIQKTRFSPSVLIAHDAANVVVGQPPSSADTVALEFAYKHRGLSVQGEYYTRHDDKNPDADGYYLQAGMFLVPEHIEIAGRIGGINSDLPNNDQSELTVGGNIFFDGHRHKLQIDLSAFEIEATGPVREDDDEQIRVQYQVAF